MWWSIGGLFTFKQNCWWFHNRTRTMVISPLWKSPMFSQHFITRGCFHNSSVQAAQTQHYCDKDFCNLMCLFSQHNCGHKLKVLITRGCFPSPTPNKLWKWARFFLTINNSLISWVFLRLIHPVFEFVGCFCSDTGCTAPCKRLRVSMSYRLRKFSGTRLSLFGRLFKSSDRFRYGDNIYAV